MNVSELLYVGLSAGTIAAWREPSTQRWYVPFEVPQRGAGVVATAAVANPTKTERQRRAPEGRPGTSGRSQRPRKCPRPSNLCFCAIGFFKGCTNERCCQGSMREFDSLTLAAPP